MMEKNFYVIIAAKSFEELCQLCHEQIKQGYRPLGAPIIQNGNFLQAFWCEPFPRFEFTLTNDKTCMDKFHDSLEKIKNLREALPVYQRE